ncbi:CCDC90 family protein [Methylomonas sp. LL1]|uniref:CCDC90 family protein n=1 Tax=Methylomonas sp. LL1 TaxID=2785785 RepID=UPI001E47EE56|nr:CCDC90 family protein [Methylomonas sp. LL1]
MNTIPFDTLKFATRLKFVGFSEEQAAVITEIQREASNETLQQAIHDYHLDDLATKRDLKELETNLEHKIELPRADTGRMIAESKADLTR